jgi:hypothetical protein
MPRRENQQGNRGTPSYPAVNADEECGKVVERDRTILADIVNPADRDRAAAAAVETRHRNFWQPQAPALAKAL